MRGGLLLSLALLPGLCEKTEDPSKGVPPEIWHLRQVMEKEVTKDARGEYVTPEQAERFRDAMDGVAVYRNVTNVDAGAEVVYLLPRTWQWPQREGLRDLIILLGCGKGGAVMDAEDMPGPGTKFRKAVYLYLFRNGLHTRTSAMAPEDRVKAILAEAASGAWSAPQFGWREDLLWEYGAMALANDPAASVPELEKIVAEAGALRPWALATLARMDDARATEALKAFYGGGEEPDENRARAAALRFYSALLRWPDSVDVAVQVPGAAFPLLPVAGKAVAVDAAGWEARAPDEFRLRLGVEQDSIGRKAFVVDGDRASVVIAETVNRKPGNAGGPFTESWHHFRLRRIGTTWVVTRWSGSAR